MNYQQTVDYLYATLPMFSRMGSAAFKKDLTNIRILCEKLDNPHKKFKSIHVGGTNGKGSVSHMLAAVLQTAGYKTGLYTSPHLYDFRERIKINGKDADEEFIVRFVERIKRAIEEIEPSFFEITVAMAFEYFAEMKVDVAVIEVGLGGRLDSTNIIIPEISVITNIGWDHMNILGDSLEKIAIEKAGIIKDNIPVVIGEKQVETTGIFASVTKEKHAPVFFAEDVFTPTTYKLKEQLLEIEVEEISNHRNEQFTLDLPAVYQTKNICTALTAIKVLNEKGFNISPGAIHDGLQHVKQLTGLHGRWEMIHHHPTVVLEVAHNKNGIAEMLRHLQQLSFHQLHIVIGVVKDKDVEQVLQLLPSKGAYYFTQANIPRALSANELQAKANSFGLSGDVFLNVNEALNKALENASEDDLIIVCGSIFLVAEVDRALPRLKESAQD